MIRSAARLRRLVIPATAVTLAVGLAACGGGSSKGGGGAATSTTSGSKLATATINGSGATFPQAY